MNLVGITGTNGAGKGAIVEYLTSLSPPLVVRGNRYSLSSLVPGYKITKTPFIRTNFGGI